MCNTQTAEAEKWKIIKKYIIFKLWRRILSSTRNKNIPLFYFIISLFNTVYIYELSSFTAQAQRSALLCKDPKSSSNFEIVYTSTTIIDIVAVYDIKLKSPSLSSLPTSYAVWAFQRLREVEPKSHKKSAYDYALERPSRRERQLLSALMKIRGWSLFVHLLHSARYNVFLHETTTALNF